MPARTRILRNATHQPDSGSFFGDRPRNVSGLVKVVIWCSFRRTVSKLINLDLEARINGRVCLILVGIGNARDVAIRHRLAGVPRANEDSGAVVHPVETELQSQREVAEPARRVIEQPQITARLGDDLTVDKRKISLSDTMPRLERFLRTIEQRLAFQLCVDQSAKESSSELANPIHLFYLWNQ